MVLYLNKLEHFFIANIVFHKSGQMCVLWLPSYQTVISWENNRRSSVETDEGLGQMIQLLGRTNGQRSPGVKAYLKYKDSQSCHKLSLVFRMKNIPKLQIKYTPKGFCSSLVLSCAQAGQSLSLAIVCEIIGWKFVPWLKYHW